MIIGTVRIEEAQAYTSHAGYHSFHTETDSEQVGSIEQSTYGSFEVFWQDEICDTDKHEPRGTNLCHVDRCVVPAGWYWAAGFPGCLYDADPVGPFASSQQAHEDADEWSPEYDA